MIDGRTTRAEALAAHVESLISENGLSPGARIANKAELRAQTGLAAATIGEGIRLLQARGRIAVRPGPGGGIFVAETHPLVQLGQSLLTVRDRPVTVADTIVVRDALEPLIAAEAARYHDDDDVADLHDLVGRMAALVDEPERFLRANWRLHRRIAGICRNQVLATVYEGLSSVIETRTASVTHPDGDQAHREFKRQRLHLHERLVQAIAAGDVEAAVTLALEHALHDPPGA